MRLICLVALGATLLVAGCGGDDDETTTTPAASPTEEATEAAGDRGSGDVVEVMMKDIQFVPQAVTVSAGQTVRWTNEDDVAHDADAQDGQFESDLIGKGETVEWKAEGSGAIDYICSVHPNMTGTITVE